MVYRQFIYDITNTIKVSTKRNGKQNRLASQRY